MTWVVVLSPKKTDKSIVLHVASDANDSRTDTFEQKKTKLSWKTLNKKTGI